jgi:alpha-beta hydrolase superfamily lysophospholipase
MHKNMKTKTSSIVILLATSFMLSAFAGSQFTATASAEGYTEYVGTLDGAQFVVRFPDSWNGMLAITCRGFSPGPVVDARPTITGPRASNLLSKGFALAASTYGANGYCVKKGMNATYQLTRYLVDTYHITGKVFLTGFSMGGNIALLLGEKYPDVYSGVLDMYGAKDPKDMYPTAVRYANMSDAELTAELNALTAPVPPYMFSSLAMLRGFFSIAASAMVAETGGTPANASKAYEDISPMYHANISIPVITVHGTSDALIPYYQAVNYQAAVANAGRSNLYRLYPVVGGQHGDDSVSNELPDRFFELVSWSNALDAWTMTVDGRSMKAYPDLKEYVWQKNATMPPNGQYDKIGLHRLVKTGITPKGVVFLTNCPMWGTGELRISNPSSDNWTKYENNSQAIYWANRGFDVYAIDYRTHFVPKTLNASQMSFVANWGLDVWVSDIKEAAEKVKEVSGSAKFFISGECTGGMAALNYATKYWKTDLKGIILLDPNFLTIGYPIVGRMNETNTYNLTAAINNMNSQGNWVYDPMASLKPLAAYALQNPGAPAEYPPGTPLTPSINPATNRTWANITEYFTSTAGGLMGTSGNISQVEYCMANAEFLPNRIVLESNAMTGWVNCPALTYDYNDHYNEIGVPLLAFDSGLFSNRTGTLRFVNGINSIVTGIMLPTYGHLDVYVGTNSARDVSQPALDWMRGELAGLKATAFCDVTVLPGWTWWFFAHGTGGVGTRTYQWYEGTTLLQGQTAMVLPVTKNTPGTYTFYCKVTDSEGAAAYSNTVTLKVLG